MQVPSQAKEKKIKPLKQPTKNLRSLKFDTSRPDDITLKASNNADSKIKSSQLPINVKAQDINIATRQSLCTDLLAEGNIQAYIDLFYVSHKCLPNIMQQSNYVGQKLYIPQLQQAKQGQLQFYRDFGQSLVKAESRPEYSREEKQNSMNQYNSIAFNYEDQGDFISAAYFYSKVIQLAISCKNQQYELIARLGLGKCNDQQKHSNEAIQILTESFDQACIIENEQQREELTKLIGKELIEILLKKAQQYEKIDIQQTLQAYQMGLNISKRAHQIDNQAKICHKIGQVYYQEGKFQKSVQYQQKYIQLLQKAHQQLNESDLGQQKDRQRQKNSAIALKFKEMEAHASLSKCYLKLKDIHKAQDHLMSYNKMAKQSKAQNYIADSSYYLARLFEEKGDQQKAILYHQAYFQAAKSQKLDKKDRKIVDKARVTFAIAKANRNMDRYINIFQEENSLKHVLDWKIKRILK